MHKIAYYLLIAFAISTSGVAQDKTGNGGNSIPAFLHEFSEICMDAPTQMVYEVCVDISKNFVMQTHFNFLGGSIQNKISYCCLEVGWNL